MIIELLYTQSSRNFNESIDVPFDPAAIVERSIRKLAYLHSAFGQSPYSHWKYDHLTHLLVRIRWYLVECPLILTGLIVRMKIPKMQPCIVIFVRYSLLVLFTMHIELRHGLSPIMNLKIFEAYAICLVARTAPTY